MLPATRLWWTCPSPQTGMRFTYPRRIEDWVELDGAVGDARRACADVTEGLTPLTAAAQGDHYEIVQLLLQHGHVVTRPHAALCECKECVRVEKTQEVDRHHFNFSATACSVEWARTSYRHFVWRSICSSATIRYRSTDSSPGEIDSGFLPYDSIYKSIFVTKFCAAEWGDSPQTRA